MLQQLTDKVWYLPHDEASDRPVLTYIEGVGELKAALQSRTDAESKALLNIADFLVKKSVWILGGDGWAYDIGYG